MSEKLEDFWETEKSKGHLDIIKTWMPIVESQVQYVDRKVSILLVVNALFVSLAGRLVSFTNTQGDGAVFIEGFGAAAAPIAFLYFGSLALLLLSLLICLLAAMPSAVHNNPRTEIFLISYLHEKYRKSEPDQFARDFQQMQFSDVMHHALTSIQGKSAHANDRYKRLRWAVGCTAFGSVGTAVALIAMPWQSQLMEVFRQIGASG
ncbi:MAG: Pycsar system effector family protein [Pseudomonadota bacterium]